MYVIFLVRSEAEHVIVMVMVYSFGQTGFGGLTSVYHDLIVV